MKMNCLLSLYPTILVPIFSEWIDTIDLCSVDSAVCNSCFRANTLIMFSKCTTHIAMTDNEMYEWMLLRQVRPRNAILDSNSKALSLLKRLLTDITHLDSVEASCRLDVMSYLSSIKSIHFLKLDFYAKDSHVATLLSSMSIVSLDLTECFDLTPAFFSRIATLYPDLKSLSAPSFANVLSAVESCPMEYLNCNLSKLGVLNLPNTLLDCRCALKRIPVQNDCVLTIAEKYFHLTDLEINQMINDDEAQWLSTIVGPLLSVQIRSRTIVQEQRPVLSVLATRCTSLTSLHLSGVAFNETDLCLLFQKAKSLRRVELFYCSSPTEATFLILADNCCHLESIALFDVVISEKAVHQLLDSCPDLNNVNLGKTAIPDDILTRLAVGVESLSLSKYFGDNFVTRSTNRGLRCLTLSGNTALKSVVFPILFKQNPCLSHLELHSQTEVTDSTLELLARDCPNLASLMMNKCRNVAREWLMHVTRCQYLTSLQLTGATLDDCFVEALLKDKPHFIRLNLYRCTGFDGGKVLRTIAQYGANMRSVSVTESDSTTNDDVAAMLIACPKVRSLDLKRCSQLTEEALNCFKTRMMRYVNLEDCSVALEAADEFVSSAGFSCSHFRF